MGVTISSISPPDNELVSKWPEYIRGLAEAVDNLKTTIGGLSITDVALVDTQTILEVGNHLADCAFEVIFLSCDDGSADISNITQGDHGQLKIFIARTGNIKFSNDNNIILNQAHDSELEMETGDMIILVNMDGDSELGADGNWREISRSLSVV